MPSDVGQNSTWDKKHDPQIIVPSMGALRNLFIYVSNIPCDTRYISVVGMFVKEIKTYYSQIDNKIHNWYILICINLAYLNSIISE